MVSLILHLTVALFMFAYTKYRNPQKKMSVIRDQHLMLFVFVIVLGNILSMVLNILLEGIITKFDVAETPSKERPSIIEGVRCYIHNS